MTSPTRRNAIALAGVIICAAPALAVPQGSYWVQVDNSANINGADTGFENSWITLDLYVALEPGDAISALDFGIGLNNMGLVTDGEFYDDDNFTSDSVAANLTFANLIADIEFDCAVTVNGGPVDFADPVEQIDWDPAGVTGAWSVNPAQQGAGGPNGPDDMWVARITVSNLTEILGGQMFVSGAGPNGEFGVAGDNLQLGLLNICFSLSGCMPPSPGAGALLAIGAFAAARRRRV